MEKSKYEYVIATGSSMLDMGVLLFKIKEFHFAMGANCNEIEKRKKSLKTTNECFFNDLSKLWNPPFSDGAPCVVKLYFNFYLAIYILECKYISSYDLLKILFWFFIWIYLGLFWSIYTIKQIFLDLLSVFYVLENRNGLKLSST